MAFVMQCTLSFSQLASFPPPIIGKVCPDYTIHGVTKFSKSEVTISDFRGKFLILDFWGRNCLTCIKSFPHINELQNEFKGDIQFMLIASNDKKWGSGVQEFFEKISDKYKLQIPSAYDSSLFPIFNIETVPHVVIIDREGIVKAITNSENLTHTSLQKLLTDNTFPYRMKLGSPIEMDEDQSNSRAVSNQDAQELYQSSFSKWYPGEPRSVTAKIANQENNNGFRSNGISLEWLYKIAYLGTSYWKFGDSLYSNLWPHMVIKTNDSSLFKSDFNLGKGYYNYSLAIPESKNNKMYIQWAMQCDLKKYFNLQVSFEVKSMPCWELVTTEKWVQSKPTAGKKSELVIDYLGISITNRPLDDLLKSIWNYNSEQPPMLNATGFTGNIDLRLNALMTDFNDIQKALNMNGLALIKSHRDMKVMIIR